MEKWIILALVFIATFYFLAPRCNKCDKDQCTNKKDKKIKMAIKE